MTHILIPREPNAVLLRPFTGCPADELPLAWAAMVRAAEVQNARAGAAPAAVAELADADLRKALQFYANREHFILSERDTSWDTVSGEPQNFWCDEAGTATVEDGTIAKMALAGQPINFEEDDAVPALEAPAAPESAPWCPDVCPITGRPFFMWITHHETGVKVPTYGGPFDSYTLPVKGSDGSFECERYDHDRGGWLTDEIQDVGLTLVDDQSFIVAPDHPRYTEVEEFANGAATLAAAKPGSMIAVPFDLIASACSAIDKKRDAPKTLAELRRYTTGDLSRALEAPA
ncbi:hypothetical protein N7405_30460, partial [Delftia tsuruhatensis]|nr:hypothetical protein [Delftia tsuruhatensis]